MNLRASFLVVCMLIVPCCVARAEEPLNVKIMTFNIRYNNPKDGVNRWSSRRDQVAELIRRFDGDFIGVQEALPDQLAELLKLLPDYRAIVRSREAEANRGESVPILYRTTRWRIDEKQQGTFWLSDTPEKPGSRTWAEKGCPRIVTWARFVDQKTGQGLYIYNTHFDDASKPSRQKSAILLAKRIADRKDREPVLVTGDFNAGESSPVVKYLTDGASESPVKLVDTFRELYPNEKQAGTFHDFRGGSDGKKIDYILAPPGTKVRSAAILRDNSDGRYPSDHYPVTAELTLSP